MFAHVRMTERKYVCIVAHKFPKSVKQTGVINMPNNDNNTRHVLPTLADGAN